MTTNRFLAQLAGDSHAAAIEALPAWREKGIINNFFPGNIVGDTDFDSALTFSGVDLDVEERPLSYNHGMGTNPIVNHKAIVHPDFAEPAGIVGKDYGVVQHAQALDGLRSLVDQGKATLEVLQLSENGGRLDATGLLGFSEIEQLGKEKSDKLGHFIRVQNSHDGSGSHRIKLFTLRPICLNGMHSTETKFALTTRHTRNAVDYVREANHGINQVIAEAEREVEVFAQLAQCEFHLNEFTEFAAQLLQDTIGVADTDRKETKREKDILELEEFFQHGAGNVGVSKYDAFNAVTEWIGVRRDQYEDSAKFARDFKSVDEGAGAKKRRHALTLLAA